MPRGKLSGSPSNGKLVDTWYYEYQGIPDDDPNRIVKVKGIKVPVELRLHKKYTDTDEPPLVVRDVWFTLSCQNPKFSFEGSDMEALRCAMWEKLGSHFEIKWEDYFLVEIRPENTYIGVGTGFVFSYDRVQKGTAWDNSLLLKEYNRLTSYKDRIKTWPGVFTNKNGKVIACIPANKATEDSLREFSARIDPLRERLADYLKPDIIFETLRLLGTLRLLPSAPLADSTDPCREPKA